MGGFGRRFRCVCVHRPHSLVRWSKRFFWVSGMFMYLVCVSSGGCAVRSCVFRAVASAWHALVRAPRPACLLPSPRAAQPRNRAASVMTDVCAVCTITIFFLWFSYRGRRYPAISAVALTRYVPRAQRARCTCHLRPVWVCAGAGRSATGDTSRATVSLARVRPVCGVAPPSPRLYSTAITHPTLPGRLYCRAQHPSSPSRLQGLRRVTRAGLPRAAQPSLRPSPNSCVRHRWQATARRASPSPRPPPAAEGIAGGSGWSRWQRGCAAWRRLHSAGAVGLQDPTQG